MVGERSRLETGANVVCLLLRPQYMSPILFVFEWFPLLWFSVRDWLIKHTRKWQGLSREALCVSSPRSSLSFCPLITWEAVCLHTWDSALLCGFLLPTSPFVDVFFRLNSSSRDLSSWKVKPHDKLLLEGVGSWEYWLEFKKKKAKEK